jgi:hypothetical protein
MGEQTLQQCKNSWMRLLPRLAWRPLHLPVGVGSLAADVDVDAGDLHLDAHLTDVCTQRWRRGEGDSQIQRLVITSSYVVLRQS